MLYELRTYRAEPGRVEDLLRRFRQRTLDLFAEHGLDVVFIGQTEFGDDSVNELVYVLRHASYEEMTTRWAAFLGDEAWAVIRAETEGDGPLVTSVKRTVHCDRFFQ
jgi:hypothetical protein